jgi:2-keto-4-pentenoate hydratase/2-oxohepta-3-ene-1,7-dioic acid hydratase in catechol pathway
MRLITFIQNGCEQIGVRQDDAIIPVASIDPELPGSIMQLLADGRLGALQSKVQEFDGAGIAVDEIDYVPLIPRPGKIICIGRNYAAHAAEGGAATPTFPEVFFRGATSLVPHKGVIVRPSCSETLDFEGEFAAVIGQTCRHATEDSALDFVAGYTLFNDATIREYQRFASQWTVGKNFDDTGALGPELVTADELPDGMAGLSLTTKLNGELMQDGQIDNLVFPVRTLITILSECMTLEPGDVVVTGTPAGVGSARKPPVWMKHGDIVEIEVEGLGKLVNTVQDAVKLS